MIDLHKTETDDANFLSVVSILIEYFYQKYTPKNICTIHIDNWFGDKWLGFRGKMLGAAGVRDKDLDSKLVLPPFNPSRVLDTTTYGIENNIVSDIQKRDLHIYQMSESNLENYAYGFGLFVWYSANTRINTQGSIMTHYKENPIKIIPNSEDGYRLVKPKYAAYYVMLKKKTNWELSKILGSDHEDIKGLLTNLN
jgi:hypothetical protein